MHRLLVLGALLFALVTPISAQASGIPTTGTRIGLLAPPSTFAADAPFYVTQGFTCEASKTDCLIGLTHFDLYVDGQELPSATDLTFGDAGTLLSKFNLRRRNTYRHTGAPRCTACCQNRRQNGSTTGQQGSATWPDLNRTDFVW
jgi:hypothetical protein